MESVRNFPTLPQTSNSIDPDDDGMMNGDESNNNGKQINIDSPETRPTSVSTNSDAKTSLVIEEDPSENDSCTSPTDSKSNKLDALLPAYSDRIVIPPNSGRFKSSPENLLINYEPEINRQQINSELVVSFGTYSDSIIVHPISGRWNPSEDILASYLVDRNETPQIIESSITNISIDEDEDQPTGIIAPAASDVTDLDAPSVSNMFLHIDRFGFSTEDDFRAHLMVNPEDAETRRQKEIKRERKWLEMVSSRSWNDNIFTKKRYLARLTSPSYKLLKERIRKGIPDAWRGRIWQDLLQPHLNETKNRYPYRFTVDLSDLTTEDIEKDIERTFPRHELFKHNGAGQETLRRVLRAYAATDSECGYCQGMSFIAGLFLMYMTEEDAFYGLYTALHRLKPLSSGARCNLPLRSMFLPTLAETQRVLFVFEKLVMKHLPQLGKHFQDENLVPSMFATEWVMTMYCRGFSFDLVTRVWDIYLFEGYKIVYRVGLALLKILESDLLSKAFEGVMEVLRDINKYADAEVVIETAFDIGLTREEIRQFLKEYDISQN